MVGTKLNVMHLQSLDSDKPFKTAYWSECSRYKEGCKTNSFPPKHVSLGHPEHGDSTSLRNAGSHQLHGVETQTQSNCTRRQSLTDRLVYWIAATYLLGFVSFCFAQFEFINKYFYHSAIRSYILYSHSKLCHTCDFPV
jgi:hypothetical protein